MLRSCPVSARWELQHRTRRCGSVFKDATGRMSSLPFLILISFFPCQDFGGVEESSTRVAGCKLQPSRLYLPVRPFFYTFFFSVLSLNPNNKGKTANSIKSIFKLCCCCVCRFLNEVQTYSGSNKMSVQNLATVFGPNILRAKAEDPQSIVGGKQTECLQ